MRYKCNFSDFELDLFIFK